MNKKSFVLLAAAMTGVTAVAVGAVAVSGVNQMSKLSVDTSASNYKIKDFVATNNPTETEYDENWLYHTPVTFSGKTGYYERDFVSSSSYIATYSEYLTIEYPHEGDKFIAKYSEGDINNPDYDITERYGTFNFYIGFEFQANGVPLDEGCCVMYNTYGYDGSLSKKDQKAYFDIMGEDGYYILEAEVSFLANTYSLAITSIEIEYSCNI